VTQRPELIGLTIADPPERWEALGFGVVDRAFDLGGVTVTLGASGRGITSWSLTNVQAPATIDGLETVSPPVRAATVAHPNGAIEIDHLAIMTPDFSRTAAELERVGIPLSRVRHPFRAGDPSEGEPGDPRTFRQGFRRIGAAILELVEAKQAPPGPARFFGLVVTVADVEALAQRLGEQLSTPHDAVQNGRRIATLRRSAGLGTAVAFMTPEPGDQ
jgi:hypothetical protein